MLLCSLVLSKVNDGFSLACILYQQYSGSDPCQWHFWLFAVNYTWRFFFIRQAAHQFDHLFAWSDKWHGGIQWKSQCFSVLAMVLGSIAQVQGEKKLWGIFVWLIELSVLSVEINRCGCWWYWTSTPVVKQVIFIMTTSSYNMHGKYCHSSCVVSYESKSPEADLSRKLNFNNALWQAQRES